jgi:hypothetical protein
MSDLTPEKAIKIHLLIWNKILNIINEDNDINPFKEYDILDIKDKMVGHKKWKYNNPLCEVHNQTKSCPLSVVRDNKTDSCQIGCYHVGKYYDWMNKVQIRAYIRYINIKLKSEVKENV